MKVRDSGMPDEEMWDAFFSPEMTLALLGLDTGMREVAEFGCGYGTFTLAAARLAHPRGPAMEIRPKPEQCIAWGEQAGFTFQAAERIDLKPYHYGLRFHKPARKS